MAGYGYGAGQGRRRAVQGQSFAAESLALFARAGALSGAEQAKIDRRIRRLKDAGLWSIMDCVYGFKADGAKALNWKSSSFGLTASGTITHVPGRGWQGGGGALLTGFVPSTAGGNHALNDAAYGVWVFRPGASYARWHMGATDTPRSLLEATSANGITYHLNAAAAGGIAVVSVATTPGLVLAYRRGASTGGLALNGRVQTTSIGASSALPPREFYIAARNAFGSIGGPSNDLYQVALIGAAPSPRQIIDLHLAELEYVTDIVAWGDSLTDGTGASAPVTTSYPEVAADLFSPKRCVSRQGRGGQTSTQIAARMGARPITVTVTADTIPASGGVAVTAKNINILTNGGSFTGDATGTLAGVHGTMTTDGSGNWTFTRTDAGAEVPCPAGSVFEPDLASYFGGAVAWLWAGRNGASAGYTVADDIAACTDRLPRSLVLGVVTSSADTGGNIAAIAALNAGLAATYGDRFVDVMTALQAANDGSPDDLADVAAGYVPRSLRSDAVHLNDDGYAVVAAECHARTVALGW